MRQLILPILTAAFLAPAVVHAQPASPAPGDPAPAPAPKAETKKAGLVEALGGAVGGVIGSTVGAAGGPLGSAAAGMVGRRMGSGAVSVARNIVGGDDDPDIVTPKTFAHEPGLPLPLTAADIGEDAMAKAPDPTKLYIPPSTDAPSQQIPDQSIQRASPEAASAITPVTESSSPSNAASPGG